MLGAFDELHAMLVLHTVPLKLVEAQLKFMPIARCGLTYQPVPILTPVVLSSLTLLSPVKPMFFDSVKTGPMRNSQSPAEALTSPPWPNCAIAPCEAASADAATNTRRWC